MSARNAILIAALALALAVVLGAFGAHALRARLASEEMAAFQTAVQYHAWHALGLFGVGLLMLHWPQRNALGWAAWLLIGGMVCFSGSLYLLALTGVREFGLVTPFGGVALILAWLAVAWSAWRH